MMSIFVKKYKFIVHPLFDPNNNFALNRINACMCLKFLLSIVIIVYNSRTLFILTADNFFKIERFSIQFPKTFPSILYKSLTGK